MSRLHTITGALDAKGVDGLLISDRKNVRYLSGFSGSSGCLLITKDERFFLTDFRYEEQAGREVRGFTILIEKEDSPKLIIEQARSAGVKILGCESTVTYAFYRSLLRKGLKIKAVSNAVEEMRRIKERAELGLITKAVARAEKAFTDLKPFIRKGLSEKEIAGRLEENLKKNGCSAVPFDIIVAAGPNSSMPHARPSQYRLKAGDLIVIDWGGEAGGYFSDMTRTLLVNGRNISRQREIYDTVLSANMEAIGSVKDGVHARMVDRAARDVIKKAGYGNLFGHGTGHGVGLDVHELPRISRVGRDHVKEGMVFTIEPGIYLPGLGGVRIEDMVLVSKNGGSVLTSLPKKLEIVD